VVERLLARDDALWLSRSWTTRAPRPGEPADAYVFVTDDEFARHVDYGGFLEWAEFQGHRYGTPLPDPPLGRDVVLEIEVQGARQVQQALPDALLIFLDAPSRMVQAERLRRRGDPEEAIERRLAAAEIEVAAAREMGMTMLVNDDLDDTVARVHQLIEARRSRRS
jgi:guanylate kinase